MLRLRSVLPMLLLGLVACGAPQSSETPSDAAAGDEAGDQVVRIFSARHYDTDDELFRRFERETGIRVEMIDGDSAALLERLRRDGERSPADLFVAVDAGRLHQAQQDGIFQAVSSPVLEERVPAHLRHPEGYWFGLTKRARVILYAKDRVSPEDIASYEDLADPQWKGRVLIRSSSNIYNQSLVGSILAAAGEEAAMAWCQGLVANFARTPQGGDRDQIRAVAAGEGDVAVANTYYLAQMIAADDKPEDQAAAAKVGVIFPNQGGRGTHVNLSGAGVVQGAANRDNAIRLLEYLTGPEAQAVFAGDNKEYPVAAGSPVAPELETFGAFQEDTVNASVYGGRNRDALMLMDRCGWR